MRLFPGLEDYDDVDQSCDTEDPHWTLGLSAAEQRDLLSHDPSPPLSQWKESSFPDNDIIVTLDKARADVGKQADLEFAFFRSKLVEKEVLPADNERQGDTVTMDNLVDWVFGKDSNLFRVFADNINYVQLKGHKFFLKYLSVYFYTGRWDVS